MGNSMLLVGQYIWARGYIERKNKKIGQSNKKTFNSSILDMNNESI